MDIEAALGRQLPFARHIGIQLLCKGDGKARLQVDVRPELMNSWDAVHGGVTMTLLDIALAVALRSLDPEERGAITVELKVNFVGPGLGTLVADGRCVHRGKTIAFCEGEVHDSHGKLVATASGTFMLRRVRATGAATAHQPAAHE
jgi:uncharacterized protein (TIGR00369 family)